MKNTSHDLIKTKNLKLKEKKKNIFEKIKKKKGSRLEGTPLRNKSFP